MEQFKGFKKLKKMKKIEWNGMREMGYPNKGQKILRKFIANNFCQNVTISFGYY